jgi:hypothetical protein
LNDKAIAIALSNISIDNSQKSASEKKVTFYTTAASFFNSGTGQLCTEPTAGLASVSIR